MSSKDIDPPRRGWPRPGELPAAVVAVVVGVVQVIGSTGADYNVAYPHRSLDALGYALLVVSAAALLLRRRHPIPVLAVVIGSIVGYMLRGYPAGPIFLAPIVAIIAAITAGRRVPTWIVLAVGYVALNVVEFLVNPNRYLSPSEWSLAHALVVLVVLLLFATGAELVRIRSERANEMARVRAEEERRRASEERLKIARELHDVLAHNISMINVQAGVALHLMDDRPEQARTALAAIKDASKEALTEVRSVLGVLRRVDESAPRAPAAGLDRLDDIVARARAAGLTVGVRVEGERRPLPAGVDLAAFRIVQESLTNVTRHAGPGVTASVRIAYGDDDLIVRVADDGQGDPGTPSTGGNGISGMRERVAALGGELFAGPAEGGGFLVRVRLPVNAAQQGDKGGAS